MKQILVDCAACSGSGKADLPPHLRKTLDIIQRQSPVTASEIYRQLKRPQIVRSSVNQFVNKLLKLGLVKTEKQVGELRVYLPV